MDDLGVPLFLETPNKVFHLKSFRIVLFKCWDLQDMWEFPGSSPFGYLWTSKDANSQLVAVRPWVLPTVLLTQGFASTYDSRAAYPNLPLRCYSVVNFDPSQAHRTSNLSPSYRCEWDVWARWVSCTKNSGHRFAVHRTLPDGLSCNLRGFRGQIRDVLIHKFPRMVWWSDLIGQLQRWTRKLSAIHAIL